METSTGPGEGPSGDLGDGAVLGLIQEQRLEHVVVEGRVVAAGPGAVWAEVQLQDLRLHHQAPCPNQKACSRTVRVETETKEPRERITTS